MTGVVGVRHVRRRLYRNASTTIDSGRDEYARGG